MNAHDGGQSGTGNWQSGDWWPGEWQPPEWSATNDSSSLNSSSLDDSQAYDRQDKSQDGNGGPNPFSREGSSPGDALGSSPADQPPTIPQANPTTGSATPTGSASSAGSNSSGGSYSSGGSLDSAGSQPSAPSYPPPVGLGQPSQPYGLGPEPIQPYGQESIPPYGGGAMPASGGGAMPGYGAGMSAQEPAPYGGNPYDATVNPYQEAGPYSNSPYGMAQQHPQATTAMILGIVGLFACAPVGIAGLVMGSKARKEIDAEPGRYLGRGQATAGFVLGIISAVLTLFWVLVIIAGIAGSS